MTRLTCLKIIMLVAGVFEHVGAMEIEVPVDTSAKEPAETIRTPIGMFIAYHQKSWGKIDKYKDLEIDSSATFVSLFKAIEKKAPVILTNGVIAYPLLIAALAGYLEKKSLPLPDQLQNLPSLELKPEKNYCLYKFNAIRTELATQFLTEYTPYLIKKPASDIPKSLSGSPDESEKYTDERFVLFVRKDAKFKIDQAFNLSVLEEISLPETAPDITEKTLVLLEEIKRHKENSNTIARSISGIFNTAQQRYSWNIILFGHGYQMTLLKTPLLARIGPVKVMSVKPAEGTDKTELKARIELAIEQKGVIANMPPRQFGLLLNSFTTLPINILLLISCYSGGYNAALMEQQLEILEDLSKTVKTQVSLTEIGPELAEKKSKNIPLTTQEQIILDGYTVRFGESPSEKEASDLAKAIQTIKTMSAHEKQRKFILVSQAAFDNEIRSGDLGQWLQEFDELFSQTPRPSDAELKEHIKNILWDGCKYSPIVLMPASKEFELITKPECLDELSKAVAVSKQTSPRSIGLLMAAQKDPIKKFNIFNLLQRQMDQGKLTAYDHLALVLQMAQKYPDIAIKFINEANYGGDTALIVAIKNGDIDIIDKLLALKGINVDENKTGKTSLMVTTQTENLTLEKKLLIIDKLLAKGAEIDKGDYYGRTALMHAAESKTGTDVVEMLLNKGAKIDEKDNSGRTALMHAAESETGTDVVEMLLDKGAKINEKDNSGRTALIYAIEESRYQTDEVKQNIIRKLLDKGAKIDEKDNEGTTALMHAIKENCYQTDEVKQNIIRKLLDKGAKIDEKDLEGTTALMFASASETSMGVVEMLLNKGAKIDEKDNSGRTALMHAAGSKIGVDVVEMLLNKGAKIDEKDNSGRTALIYAIEESRYQTDKVNQNIIRKLLDKGAKIDKLTIDFAKEHNVSQKIMEMLEEAAKQATTTAATTTLSSETFTKKDL